MGCPYKNDTATRNETMNSFDQFINDLTAGDADLKAMNAATTKPAPKKTFKKKAPAKMTNAPKMTNAARAGLKAEAFDEQNAGLYTFLREQTWSDFAQSLADGILKFGSLTDKQMSAAQSMRLKVEAKNTPAPAAKSTKVGGFGEVVALMDHIQASGAKYPRVRIQTKGGQDFIITRKMSGTFAGTDSMNLGNSVQGPWLGSIVTSGDWTPSRIAAGLERDAKADLWETLQALQNDPKAVFAENGKRLGRCACCGKPLSDQTSVERGIGPECWGKL